jgi:aspartyl aminopeptidase
MAASIGAPVADIGIPLWAMHSAREVGAWADLLHLSRLTKAAFERSPEVER